MWRNVKLIHMWRNFRFLHICHVQEFEISPHDRFFSLRAPGHKYNLNQEEDDIIVQGSKDTSDNDAEDKGEEGRVGKGQEEQVDV